MTVFFFPIQVDRHATVARNEIEKSGVRRLDALVAFLPSFCVDPSTVPSSKSRVDRRRTAILTRVQTCICELVFLVCVEVVMADNISLHQVARVGFNNCDSNKWGPCREPPQRRSHSNFTMYHSRQRAPKARPGHANIGQVFSLNDTQPGHGWNFPSQASYRHVNMTGETIGDISTTARQKTPSPSPLYQLPPELLSRCFWFLATLEHPQAADLWGVPHYVTVSGYSLGWIRVTHVCSLWRNVCIADARLWANIPCAMGSRWTKEMILRSKAAPLSIQIPNFDAASDLFTSIVRDQTSRIQELTIMADADGLASVFSEMPVAQMLDTLALTQSARPNDFHFVALSAHLGTLLPRLRRLILSEIQLPPTTSSLFSTLVELSIETNHLHTTRAYPSEDLIGTAGNLFAILEATPLLERLSIRRCLPRMPSTIPSTGHLLALPRLARLTLDAPTRDIALFLAHIEIPQPVQLDFICSPQGSTFVQELEHGSSLFKFISAHTCHVKFPPVHTLSIAPYNVPSYENHALSIKTWSIPDNHNGPPLFAHRNDDSTFSLAYEFKYAKTPSFVTICELFDITQLNVLRVARVYGWKPVKPETWLVALAKVQNLRAVAPIGDLTTSFYSALLLTPRTEPPVVEEPGGEEVALERRNVSLFLPSLETIDLRLQNNVIKLNPFRTHNASSPELIETLEKRKEWGSPIGSLMLSLSSVTGKGVLDKLFTLVSRIYWGARYEGGGDGE